MLVIRFRLKTRALLGDTRSRRAPEPGVGAARVRGVGEGQHAEHVGRASLYGPVVAQGQEVKGDAGDKINFEI